MKVAIGADHGGYELKTKIIRFLERKEIEFEDFGTDSDESCDYNDVALQVAQAVHNGQVDKGVLVCGTGVGMSIQANKVNGIRAALVHDLFTAKATRAHNDSNILCMGGRVIGEGVAMAIVDTWLHTPFSNEERHVRRVQKIEDND